MEKKLKKEKHKLYLYIMTAMFLLSLIVFVTISISILSNEKQRLEAETYTEFTQIADNTMYLEETASIGIDELVNLKQDLDNRAHVVISDVSNTNDRSAKILAETKNAVSVSYYDKDKVTWYGTIDFEEFRNTLTDEQYETICDYLLKDEDKNGEYYILVCTEFYHGNNDIKPKVIEVLRTKEENDWYVQDTVVEHYELEPTVLSGDILYTSPGDMKNLLYKDFVLGKYEVKRHLDTIDEFFRNFDSDEYYATHREPLFPMRTGLFEYLVYYNDYSSGYRRVYTDEAEGYEYTIVDETDGLLNMYWLVTEPYAYDIRYAKEINIIRDCIGSIILMAIYILVLFAVVGIIIGAVSWNSIKKQIEQEQRLRTVTNAMAHELKTPLFIVGGYCENLMENINSEKREHYAYVISQQTQEMNELVVKMLEYSKLDSKSFEPKMESFNITALVRELISNYDLYNIELERDNEINITADKKLITSVIENLLDNAIKYTTDIDQIKVAVKNGKLTVSNPCAQLSKQDIDNMWQPYHRNADNSEKEGFGLGLAIVKSICEMHKMKYRAEYADGKITFEFSLPKSS